jgi:pyridinium-3,5-bisthiocarboxylic acid mononucleotide nickel chelatase
MCEARATLTPMRRAYFDCFSGISGDMVLGALVDAGADAAHMEAELRRLPVSRWQMRAERVKRRGIAATKIHVDTQEHHTHRGLAEILGMIHAAGFAPRVAERASRIFTRLGEAEAKIHGVSIERIHFHEVGAVDSIVDIVGAAIGFELLGIEEFYFSSLNLGAGRIQAAHGILPVPAPATAELLRGAPVYSSGMELELVTPTGAAIAATLASGFGAMPSMKVGASGYGAGSADPHEQANVLRVVIGESDAVARADGWDAPVIVMETNVDDMSPEMYGYFAEQAMAAGALDVFTTPAQMKKNRPGMLVTVICEPEKKDQMAALILRETTSIGVRMHETQRQTLERESVTVETALGPVRMKVASRNGAVLNAAPEYEDCRKLAMERGVPLKEVLALAMHELQKLREQRR